MKKAIKSEIYKKMFIYKIINRFRICMERRNKKEH